MARSRLHRTARFLPLRLAALGALLGITLVALNPAAASHAQTAPAGQPKYGYYDVIISGTANGYSFMRTARMGVFPTVTAVTRNGVNPYDVCLISGSPAAHPETGAIQFGTNSKCWGGGANLDLVSTAVLPDGAVADIVDPTITANTNLINAQSGLTADVYRITSGFMRIAGSGGLIFGNLNFTGTAFVMYGTASYVATFTAYWVAPL